MCLYFLYVVYYINTLNRWTRGVGKNICLQRAAGGGIAAARVFTEWTCEGSLKFLRKSRRWRGNLPVTSRECMLVHERVADVLLLWSRRAMWVVPQEIIKILVPVPLESNFWWGRDFFDIDNSEELPEMLFQKRRKICWNQIAAQF